MESRLRIGVLDLSGGASVVEAWPDPASVKFAWGLLEGETILDPVEGLLDPFPLTAEDVLEGDLQFGVESRADGFALLCSAVRCEGHPLFARVAVFARERQVLVWCPEPVADLQRMMETWERMAMEVGESSGEVVYSVLDTVIDTYFPAMDTMHERLAALEDDVLQGSTSALAEVVSLKRDLSMIRRHVVPLRESVNSLLRVGRSLITEARYPEYQDLYNHCLRVTESIDMAKDMVTGLMDVQLNMVSNRLNDVMRTLTVISTVLMTSTLIAGIYGMNFRYMPELYQRWGYPASLGLMLVAGFGIYFWFKKMGFLRKD